MADLPSGGTLSARGIATAFALTKNHFNPTQADAATQIGTFVANSFAS